MERDGDAFDDPVDHVRVDIRAISDRPCGFRRGPAPGPCRYGARVLADLPPPPPPLFSGVRRPDHSRLSAGHTALDARGFRSAVLGRGGVLDTFTSLLCGCCASRPHTCLWRGQRKCQVKAGGSLRQRLLESFESGMREISWSFLKPLQSVCGTGALMSHFQHSGVGPGQEVNVPADDVGLRERRCRPSRRDSGSSPN